jgi:hypothetical protein
MPLLGVCGLYRGATATAVTGDYIDVVLTESAIAYLEGTIPEYVHGGVTAERNGNRYLRARPAIFI